MDRDVLLSIQSELCRVNDNLEEIKDAVNELQGEVTRKKKLVPFGGYGVNTLQGEEKPEELEELIDKAREEGRRSGFNELRTILKDATNGGAITKDPELEIKRVLIDIDLLEEHKLKPKE